MSLTYDGDTIKLREGLNYHCIRLASIDAPEKDQPYGLEATLLLKRLVLNKTVLAKVIDTDKYGRKVAYIYFPHKTIYSEQPNHSTQNLADANPNLLTVNCYLLTVGAAWHLSYFDRNNPVYAEHAKLQRMAKTMRIGLWKQDKPIEPWR